jgi:hypothetical protein
LRDLCKLQVWLAQEFFEQKSECRTRPGEELAADGVPSATPIAYFIKARG